MSIVLFLIAAWLFLCLVMLPNNHMRIALFGLILMPLGLFAVFLRWVAERILKFNRWFGGLGHDK
jgi:hypothetical protein